MQSLANRLAIQHFVNAYTQETGKGHLLNKNQQSPQQQAFSQGLRFDMKTISQQLPDYFEYHEDGTQYYLRQVQYPQDIPLLHQWMHEPHVIPQWQLNKSELDLQVYFDKMLADDHQRLLIVGVDSKDVGYTEIYEGKRDRLGRYYEGDDNDLGWYLLFDDKSLFSKVFYIQPFVCSASIFLNIHKRKKLWVSQIIPLNLMQQWW